MLLQDLSSLWCQSIREADLELHNEVSPLRGDLGKGKALPSESLHCARLDDIIAGQRNHSAINGGNVHGAAAQRLRKMRQRVREGKQKRGKSVPGRKEGVFPITPPTHVHHTHHTHPIHIPDTYTSHTPGSPTSLRLIRAL